MSHEIVDKSALRDDPAAGGYSDDDVAGILGENFLRHFERVWKD